MANISLKGFFEFLCSLKNEAGWVQEPKGRALTRFLAEKTSLCPATVGNNLKRLADLKYIEKEFHGRQKAILWRVKILANTWDESLVTEKHGQNTSEKTRLNLAPNAEEPTVLTPTVGTSSHPNPEPEPAKTPEKRFAVFMDYSNLERNLPKTTDCFRNFSWLLDPILKRGKIIFAFVFIPDHYVSRAPIMQLTHKHHFHAIFCPRQISGTITKDADTVDAQMQELGWALIQHSDITDVIIVSGDADFQRLATHAKWQQKRVMVVSSAKALSGRFLEMSQEGALTIRLVS